MNKRGTVRVALGVAALLAPAAPIYASYRAAREAFAESAAFLKG